MKLVCVRAILSLTLLALAACGGTADIDGEGEQVDGAESALLGDNALNPNALNPNALNPNALDPSALSQHALGASLTSQEVLDALQAPGSAGALSRQLLRYVVRCALKDNQSVSFSWSDDDGVQHQEIVSTMALNSYPDGASLACRVDPADPQKIAFGEKPFM